MARAPYELKREEKDKALTERLKALSLHHYANCPEYARMADSLGIDLADVTDYRELPFLPVGLFKRMRLSSIREDTVTVKTVTSSGTTGQERSQIVLDGNTRTAQQQALAMIGCDFLGEERLPMLVIDCPATVADRNRFSARTAGIQGFSIFGRARTFALRDDMSIDVEAVEAFLEKYGKKPFLVFGFTYIIWQYFLEAAGSPGHGKIPAEEVCPGTPKGSPANAAEETWPASAGVEADMSEAVLIHGGGWKKLADLNITEAGFRDRLKEQLGITHVHDYYGMAEQTGSIFMECECGHLHCSDYSGIVIRRTADFSPAGIGEEGLIQVLSTLPESYPGHSLLTEDRGVLLGEDDCPCGRAGAYFRVLGRVKHAEIRGCSDTFEDMQAVQAGEHGTEDAETPQTDECGIEYIVGNARLLSELLAANNVSTGNSWKAFSEETLDFLNLWSDKIRALPRELKTGAVSTFGFRSRRSALEGIKGSYNDIDGFGVGTVFQIVPSNMPALWAYSLASALLAGCPVVMRLPSGKGGPAISDPLLSSLRETLEELSEWKSRIVLIRYGHDKAITDELSGKCSGRIIWGGDRAVEEIRRSQLGEGAADIAFPNRHSMAVMDAQWIEGLTDDELETLVRNFRNDTYSNDQNACSAPNIIYWLEKSETGGTPAGSGIYPGKPESGNGPASDGIHPGKPESGNGPAGSGTDGDNEQSGRKRFWDKVNRLTGDYQVPAEIAVKKLEAALFLAGMGLVGKHGICCGGAASGDNSGRKLQSVRVQADHLDSRMWDSVVPGGFFIESSGTEKGMRAVITDICQTITCSDENTENRVRMYIEGAAGRGELAIHNVKQLRIRPVGHALDYELVWDGHDIIRELQRCR